MVSVTIFLGSEIRTVHEGSRAPRGSREFFAGIRAVDGEADVFAMSGWNLTEENGKKAGMRIARHLSDARPGSEFTFSIVNGEKAVFEKQTVSFIKCEPAAEGVVTAVREALKKSAKNKAA